MFCQTGSPDLPEMLDVLLILFPSSLTQTIFAADDPINVGRFEQVSDDHLGARGSQRRRPFVLAADHRPNRKPAFDQQARHRSPDGSELPGCPGDEDGTVTGRPA